MKAEKKAEALSHKGRVIRTEIRTTATPQQVWEAWTDPQKIAQWFVDKAEGKPEIGTTYTWIFEKFNYTIPYEVLLAEPNRRFALQWSAPGRQPGIIDVTIERDAGETLVRLVNSGFQETADWDEEYEGIVSGWQMSLAFLKHYVENYFGEPRSSFLAMAPATFSYQQLGPYYRQPQLLAQWLTTSGAIGDAGRPCRLDLRLGLTLNGQVLARTAWEVAASWLEIRGALELKGFSMGPGTRMVAVRGCGWGLDSARAREIERHLQGDVERLATLLTTSPPS